MMVTAKSKMLVRADAGPTIGTGHVMRTMALGQAWKQRGGSVTFVCGELPRALINRIDAEGFKVVQVKNDGCDGADATDTAEIVSAVRPDWVVLDGSRFDDAYQHTVCPTNSKLLVIDDYGHATHRHADLILNQNIYASPSQYSETCGGKVLAGPQYVLLQNELGYRSQRPLEAKRIVSEARRILVSFGGSDSDNWTLKTLQVLSDLNRKRLVVDCVVSPSYEHCAELEMFKKTANLSLRIHRNADRISQLISRIDLAITAGGSTCYELAHLGVPTIVVATAENQQEISRAMNERGVMVSVDETSFNNLSMSTGSCSSDTKLRHAIQCLINDPDQRKAMSDLGRRLVDGNGAQRIARALAAGTFSIRLAEIEDVNAMWHWQNDPEVRSVSFDENPIPIKSFSDSLQQRLNHPQIQNWIAEDSCGQPIGQVLIDSIDASQPPVVSIIIDQTRRGRGLGTLLILRCCEEYFQTSNADAVVAQIKPGNVASEKAFRAAGFLGIEPTIVNGKMAIQFVLNRSSRTDSNMARVARKKSA